MLGEVAKILLSYYHDSSADIAAQDVVGKTPLHWAVGCADKDMVALLLSRGANFNV
ncbi:ankyrin repeat domain-containing protein [bacterium]|nr:MAG: ankyrin repeat domain-containing protein [bacterium]